MAAQPYATETSDLFRGPLMTHEGRYAAHSLERMAATPTAKSDAESALTDAN